MIIRQVPDIPVKKSKLTKRKTNIYKTYKLMNRREKRIWFKFFCLEKAREETLWQKISDV